MSGAFPFLVRSANDGASRFGVMSLSDRWRTHSDRTPQKAVTALLSARGSLFGDVLSEWTPRRALPKSETSNLSRDRYLERHSICDDSEISVRI